MARGTDPAVARHVKDLYPELDALFEAGDQVKAVQATSGWGVVHGILGAEIDAINAQMETQVLEQAEYAMRHGRIGGLRAAQSAVDTIVAIADARRAEQQARHEAGGESPAER